MRRLFKEYTEDNEINNEDALEWLYIGDEQNFKKQVTIRDYYRIILVDNAGELSVDDLNNMLIELKNRDGMLDYVDYYDELAEIINAEYSLELEFYASSYYEDLDHFKHGNIVYDMEKCCFDLAENWDEIVTTYLYKEEHGYIAAIQAEIIDENTESSFAEVHITELDETEEFEDEEDSDKEFVVLEKKVIETTTVKKIMDNKYLIVVTSKLPGHLDMAATASEKEMIEFLENECIIDIEGYMVKFNTLEK
ncbi:MAG: hypothetical protein VB128_06860 [Sedimentibacter saalensis]|uniref:hypothetical protein n=1 Tax=Sedimentibacter saalensis TaxID=130788 RepID=UPI002B2141B2|nr:hypothetical protein [Sedimentibacter saalensis]MEA5094653.1 hypothetical protein [Sedimentibacter saalensis]